MKIINCPKSWADVALADYIQFNKQLKPYFNTDKYTEKAVLFGMFNFTDITEEEYRDLPESTFSEIEKQMLELLNSTQLPLIKSFQSGDTTYGFIPNLDDMAYGEYLDLVSYTSKDVWEEIATVMAILYRPIDKKLLNAYTIEKYSGTSPEVISLFSNILTMDIVFGAISFFLGLQTDLMKGTLTYSMQTLMTSKDPRIIAAREDLLKNGTDTTQLQHLQEMMLQNLTQLQS
jgi:hypothetical protein